MCSEHVSVDMNAQRMHLIGWQNAWEQAPGVPAPSPPGWRGSKPDPVPVHRALPASHITKLHTGTSNTLSMNCNCGNSMVRRTACTMGTHLCATTKKTKCTTCATGKSITVSSNWGISWSNKSLDRETQPLRNDRMNCTTCATGTSTTMSGIQETLWSRTSQDHGRPPLRQDRETRTISNQGHRPHVQEQLGNLYGLLNSKTMGIDLRTATGKIDDLRGAATAENPQFSARRHVTFLLVHTGRDDKHLGPEDNKKEYSARCTVTSKTSPLRNCQSVPYRP